MFGGCGPPSGFVESVSVKPCVILSHSPSKGSLFRGGGNAWRQPPKSTDAGSQNYKVLRGKASGREREPWEGKPLSLSPSSFQTLFSGGAAFAALQSLPWSLCSGFTPSPQ